ncbi:hypothetical protein GGI13_004857 [Coemansia sp. RSA 455]|nr:hypothetical protein GGI14_002226 [Coemansia sp. S680]KAJ2032522.1 hypothetical protein H4S03_006199 [Coemansia sp. S3946]KAJ2046698.1 hypothetical protein H4S04_004890 [Coemansia sp. S16]KAJ2105447.1 hypothetical protein IW146_008218 [Coemansia sp. RSA 922]KAJ2247925.1 hypothetical protein GGI13_004857 [Coemansia sp. RSA 455]KAJ2343966.1 hypothetical protein GGH92_004686 [Coemansia sp. RSA 2673]
MTVDSHSRLPAGAESVAFTSSSLTNTNILPEHELRIPHSRTQSIRNSIASEHFFEEDVAEPTGTILSSTINLANTILGSGMLSMPNAMAALGLAFGSLVIIFSACASGMGLYLLSRCARRSPGRDSSFFSVSKLTYPKAAVFFDAAIAIKCFGVSISYLIIFGDLMPEIASALGFSAQLLLSRSFWITVAIIALIPLAFQRRLDALKYTSFTALLAVVYLFIVVAMFFFTPTRKPLPKGDIVMFKWSKEFFTHLPVFVFAFTCHQNIFSVYNELRDNSSKQVNGTIKLSIGSACAVYQWIAILGYLTFGSKVAPNLLTMYDNGRVITFCRLSIAILVLFSYPLQCHPARNCLDKVITGIYHAFSKEPTFEAIVDEDDAGNAASTIAASDEATQAPVVHVMSPAKHISITFGLMLLSYVASMSVTSLDLVLSFVGSTGSTSISFILPGIFYYKMHQNVRWTRMKVISVLITLYGLFILVFCLGANISRVINGDL